MQAPLSKRQVTSMRSEDVLGTLDKETSAVGIACLGDAKLRIGISGLSTLWLNPTGAVNLL